MPEQNSNADFEDDRPYLNKEAQTRRHYLRWFNKRREDFQSDILYDNYLEMVEDIIFNVVNNIDVEKTKARVEKYRRENHDLIGQNHAKRLEEDRLAAERVSMAERNRITRLAELREQDRKLELEKLAARRQAEAEELLRVAKGDRVLEKLKRRQAKDEKKRRKKEAAAARAAEEAAKPDFRPVWYGPAFPTALPVPVGTANISDDQRPQEDDKQIDHNKAASAAGFRQQYVYDRALLEFEQSLSLLQLRDKQ